MLWIASPLQFRSCPFKATFVAWALYQCLCSVHVQTDMYIHMYICKYMHMYRYTSPTHITTSSTRRCRQRCRKRRRSQAQRAAGSRQPERPHGEVLADPRSRRSDDMLAERKPRHSVTSGANGVKARNAACGICCCAP